MTQSHANNFNKTPSRSLHHLLMHRHQPQPSTQCHHNGQHGEARGHGRRCTVGVQGRLAIFLSHFISLTSIQTHTALPLLSPTPSLLPCHGRTHRTPKTCARFGCSAVNVTSYAPKHLLRCPLHMPDIQNMPNVACFWCLALLLHLKHQNTPHQGVFLVSDASPPS